MLSPLSKKSQVILELLAGGDERYGLEMVKAEPKQLKRGTIYVTLSRLEDQGLVTSREVKPDAGRGPARRVYRITGAGERLLEASLAFNTAIAGSVATSIMGGEYA
ncbi:MAG: PadR family transcriptional regulator [Planctomycetota bacterium]